MAWRRSGDKPLSEPMMDSLLTHICVTRPQWVKQDIVYHRNWGTVAKKTYALSGSIWGTKSYTKCMDSLLHKLAFSQQQTSTRKAGLRRFDVPLLFTEHALEQTVALLMSWDAHVTVLQRLCETLLKKDNAYVVYNLSVHVIICSFQFAPYQNGVSAISVPCCYKTCDKEFANPSQTRVLLSDDNRLVWTVLTVWINHYAYFIACLKRPVQ